MAMMTRRNQYINEESIVPKCFRLPLAEDMLIRREALKRGIDQTKLIRDAIKSYIAA